MTHATRRAMLISRRKGSHDLFCGSRWIQKKTLHSIPKCTISKAIIVLMMSIEVSMEQLASTNSTKHRDKSHNQKYLKLFLKEATRLKGGSEI